MSNQKKAKKKLELLLTAIEEDILSMSDDEILKEVVQLRDEMEVKIRGGGREN